MSSKRKKTRINLNVPFNLPSVEENLRDTAITLEILSQLGLPKAAVKRLSKKMKTLQLHQRLFSKYVHHRRLELEMIKLARKYEESAMQPNGSFSGL